MRCAPSFKFTLLIPSGIAYPTLSAPCLWLQFGFNQAASPSRSGSQFAHFTATVNLRCARSSFMLTGADILDGQIPGYSYTPPLFNEVPHTLNTPTHLWAYSNYTLCSIKLGKSAALQDRVASETQSSRRPFILLECLTQHGGSLLTICRYLCYPIPSTSMSSQVRQILGSSHRIWN